MLALLWVLSGSLCAYHCSHSERGAQIDNGSVQTAHGCCHKGGDPRDPSPGNGGDSEASCVILALAAGSPNGPAEGVAWIPSSAVPFEPVSSISLASPSSVDADISPARASDRPSLPAEFLGPAFRSLAPPSVS
jgi:hypothetical protein